MYVLVSWEYRETVSPLYIFWEYKLVQLLESAVWQLLPYFKIQLPFDPMFLFLEMYLPLDIFILSPNDVYRRLFTTYKSIKGGLAKCKYGPSIYSLLLSYKKEWEPLYMLVYSQGA